MNFRRRNNEIAEMAHASAIAIRLQPGALDF